MTDDALTPELLASGYLDDELTPDERTLVEADPDLLALVEAHRAVRASVAQPVPPLSAAQKDAMVSAALADLPSADRKSVV